MHSEVLGFWRRFIDAHKHPFIARSKRAGSLELEATKGNQEEVLTISYNDKKYSHSRADRTLSLSEPGQS